MEKCGPKVINPIERFNTKYVVDPINECWNWVASKNKKGYGKFSITRRNWIGAHRFSYEYYLGPIDNNLCVLHKCDNPSCVRPDHLFLGTRKDNSDDKVSKNRQFRPKGILSPLHKLTEKEVYEIKEKLLYPYYGINVDLAKFYKVDPRTISGIKTGKRWSHLVID